MKKLIGILMLVTFAGAIIFGLILSCGLSEILIILFYCVICVVGAAWVIAAFYLIAGY